MSTQAKLKLEQQESRITDTELKPIIEALIYVAEEPIAESTLIGLLGQEHKESVKRVLKQLEEQYRTQGYGIEIKEIANGYKMGTKPEHHEWIRKYLKHQIPPTKLSLAALETLAVIAYKQPITVPEIQEIRGVNAVAVLRTLLDKKLVTTTGRKNVVGRPILYKTTKEFLVHFGLKNLGELPSLEEFEELARSSLGAEVESAASQEQLQVEQVENLDVSLQESSALEDDRVDSVQASISPEEQPEESEEGHLTKPQ